MGALVERLVLLGDPRVLLSSRRPKATPGVHYWRHRLLSARVETVFGARDTGVLLVAPVTEPLTERAEAALLWAGSQHLLGARVDVFVRGRDRRILTIAPSSEAAPEPRQPTTILRRRGLLDALIGAVLRGRDLRVGTVTQPAQPAAEAAETAGRRRLFERCVYPLLDAIDANEAATTALTTLQLRLGAWGGLSTRRLDGCSTRSCARCRCVLGGVGRRLDFLRGRVALTRPGHRLDLTRTLLDHMSCFVGDVLLGLFVTQRDVASLFEDVSPERLRAGALRTCLRQRRRRSATRLLLGDVFALVCKELLARRLFAQVNVLPVRKRLGVDVLRHLLSLRSGLDRLRTDLR